MDRLQQDGKVFEDPMLSQEITSLGAGAEYLFIIKEFERFREIYE